MTRSNESATEDAATAEAIATREQPKGVAAAIEALRSAHDEDAQILWTTGGPRKSHLDEIAGVMVEIDGARRIVIACGYASGAFKLFREVAGKTPEAILANLII